MEGPKSNSKICIKEFLHSGFDLKAHLEEFLDLHSSELEALLPDGANELAAAHPGSITPEEVGTFYEKDVGIKYLIELASWHLRSAEYIADTLRLQKMFAKGKVLDFGGGIGSHSLSAASLNKVDHVYFVDLNPNNREFVEYRAKKLGLTEKISFYRDLEATGEILFDTLICLDVLEHLPDPSEQLLKFKKVLTPEGISLMNWYFFKGFKGEYPFHFDEPLMVENFFITLQENFIELFHPYLITTRAYKKY
tara:strand:- start:355 stop:1107 length:753 start_codon:yes stop_codon:yes gene_type:complete